MSDNKIGQIPDFTSEEGTQEEVKQELVNGETDLQEKETPTDPPAEDAEASQKPAEEVASVDDTGVPKEVPAEVLSKEVARATEGLRNQIVELRRELATARGTDRKIIQSKIESVQEKVDDLKDVNPDDVNLIDKVLRSKGYITRGEADKMHYDTVKNEEINKFLDKFPEYKPENDTTDANWLSLQKHIQTWYRMPDDPRLVGELLLKAHREVAKAPSDRDLEVKKQQVKVASSGSSGIQRSSPQNRANPRLSELLKTHMHGWSDEEIKKMESKLPE